MGSTVRVEGLLRRGREAVLATRARTLDELDALLVQALAGFAEGIGADRCCVCFTAGPVDRPTIGRAVSGGRRGVPPLGPDLLRLVLGNAADLVDAVPDRPLAAHRSELGPVLARALRDRDCDWGVFTRLSDGDALLGTFSAVGRGAAPLPDDQVTAACSVMAELMVTVARRSAELSFRLLPPLQSRQALDLVGEGVMFLDAGGRPLWSNRAAQDLLGCGIDELDTSSPMWDQCDYRTPGGASLRSSREILELLEVNGRWGPAPIRIVNRLRLVVQGELTVRVINDAPPDGAALVVLFSPFTGPSSLGGTWTVEAVLRRADQLFDGIERALASGRTNDDLLPPALAEVDLSPREREILFRLLDGHRVSTIAQQLYLSPHTVRNHLKAIFRKTHVRSQAELITLARAPWPARSELTNDR